MRRLIHTAVIVGVVAGTALIGSTNIDPTDKYGWGENTGWLNCRASNGGAHRAVVHPTFLSGYVWGENVGWIDLGDGTPVNGTHYANMDGSDFGVNVNTNGDLFGLGWGENIGWVNFDTSSAGAQRARFDGCEGRFFGFAWGENVGWVNLDDSTHYVAVGPCAFADYECDGDVDLDDYVAFELRLGGPNVPVTCPVFDTDGDGDIDLRDFAAFQAGFTGSP